MRMRKKKNGQARIDACSELLIPCPPEGSQIQIASYFDENHSLHLEIGCGKGSFACGMAAKYPEINFIAMERISDVACLALEKAKAQADLRPCDNLRFLIADARNLTSLFSPHIFDKIYLNFSDPWPKSGYHKRRLTYRDFLDQYRQLLLPGGLLQLKTDNDALFDFSLDEFEAAGLTLLWKTDDLHHSEYADGNIMTEYETNFSSLGLPIHAATVRF